MDLLEEAKRAIDGGNIQTGWACFLAARRMRIVTASEERIGAESIALLAEAQELPGWRGKAIAELLNPKQDAEPRDQRQSLYVAYQIRDDALQNRYREVEILREQLLRLRVVLGLTVLGLLAAAIWLRLPLRDPPDPSRYHRQYVAYVALFGALGGSISAIQSVIKTSTTGSALAERRMYGPVVYMRPVFGLAAALAVFPFVVAGVLPVKVDSNAVILSVALVAGFTERFIASAVETVAK